MIDTSEKHVAALIVGYGSIAKRHINNIKTLLPDVKILILTSQTTGLPEDCFYSNNIDELIEKCPKMAIVCSPATKHIDVALVLANHGIHLFIEKPLSHDLNGTNELSAIVEKNNLVALVGYNLRFKESLQEFKRLIDHKIYGDVWHIHSEVGQNLLDWRPNADYRNTVTANRHLGGGALLELSHEVDYLTWIFGIPSYVSANMEKVSNLELDVEDVVDICFGIKEKNILGTIHLDLLQKQVRRYCRVTCEKGTLIWDGIEGIVSFESKDGVEVLFAGDEDKNLCYVNELEHFINLIDGKENVNLCSLDQGMSVMRSIEAIRRSSDLEHKVYL